GGGGAGGGGQLRGPVHLRDPHGQPGKQVELDREPDLRLVVTEQVGRCLVPLVGGDLPVAVDEHPLPRHENVVEDDQRIGLVESGGQRVVEHAGRGRRVTPA